MGRLEGGRGEVCRVFGYLRVKSCRLDTGDRKLYKSHFCAVCHQLHRFGGWDASLLTNYDVTLWSLVASGLCVDDYLKSPERKACTALPLSKVEVQPLSLPVGSSLAAITILLAWAKLEDNRQDENSLLARAGQMWLGQRERKARSYLEKQGYPVEALLQLPQRQKLAEQSLEPDLESLWEPISSVLGDSFAWIATLAKRSDLQSDLTALGEAIARYVYLWDALNDVSEDLKKGHFNAILRVWGEEYPRSEIRRQLLQQLTEMTLRLGRLPLGDRRRLCDQLVASLREKVQKHVALQGAASTPLSPRRSLPRAGFVRANDCDCCCDASCCDPGCSGDCCCDASCCDSGCDGGSCCEISCCDLNPGDSCCEISCCDFCDCCDGSDCGDFCCCISTSGRHRAAEPVAFQEGGGGAPLQETTPLCPGCRMEMTPTRVRHVHAFGCRDCGGVWMEGHQYQKLPNPGPEAMATASRHPSREPGVARGSRLCPQCNQLMRAPGDPEVPENCSGCGGHFYSPF